MSVTLCNTSYQKEKTCITGYIKCLNCYEVNLDKIEKYQLSEKDDSVFFNKGILSIDYLVDTSQVNDCGFNLENDFFFYHYANCYMSGSNMRHENDERFGIMLEPTNILATIKRLFSLVDNFSSEDNFYVGRIKEYDEKNNLGKLIKLLENAVEKDGMVCFSIG